MRQAGVCYLLDTSPSGLFGNLTRLAYRPGPSFGEGGGRRMKRSNLVYVIGLTVWLAVAALGYVLAWIAVRP